MATLLPRYARDSQGNPHIPKMNGQSTLRFRWISPLRISAILFLIFGVMGILFGIGIPIVSRSLPQFRTIVTSSRADTQLLGRAPSELFQQDNVLNIMYYAKTD